MDFDLNSDQQAFIDVVAEIVSGHADLPTAGGTVARIHSFYNQKLDDAFAEGGFYAAAVTEGLGPLAAGLMIYEAGRSPGAIELALSALLAPLALGNEFERPFAIARERDLARPIRFLPQAKTLIVVGQDAVTAIDLRDRDVQPRTATFAYPYGQLADVPDASTGTRLSAPVAQVEQLWRVGLALEAAGAMKAALDVTVDHVKQRVQFNRTIGSNQAVQHRLAECAMIVEGARWLALRAAWSQDPADASVAALYVQEHVARIAFDTHQFLGALGNTLEHALHFFTYKLRALHSEAGGKHAQARSVATSAWPRAMASG